MCGLDQAFQFVGRNHGHIAPRAPAHHDDFAVVYSAIHERFELLACLAVGGFDGHVGLHLFGQDYCTRFDRAKKFQLRLAADEAGLAANEAAAQVGKLGVFAAAAGW